MPYRADPSRPDRAKAIVAVLAVHAALGALLLARPGTLVQRMSDQPTVLIDIAPEPPPPPPETDPGKAREEEGAAGKKAEPTPIVRPEPRIDIPAPTPVAAAPVAGTGASPNAGASTAGSGPGAGGSGTGRGGGGAGGGGGLGSEARLLGGNRAKLPRQMLYQFAADRGFAHLWLTVADSGRVTDCSVMQSSGSGDVDQALCGLMIRQSRWSPARDKQGQPVTVRLRYTATWSKD